VTSISGTAASDCEPQGRLARAGWLRGWGRGRSPRFTSSRHWPKLTGSARRPRRNCGTSASTRSPAGEDRENLTSE
jgi:hypothetical protein